MDGRTIPGHPLSLETKEFGIRSQSHKRKTRKSEASRPPLLRGYAEKVSVYGNAKDNGSDSKTNKHQEQHSPNQ